jgi:hypothetical protein
MTTLVNTFVAWDTEQPYTLDNLPEDLRQLRRFRPWGLGAEFKADGKPDKTPLNCKATGKAKGNWYGTTHLTYSQAVKMLGQRNRATNPFHGIGLVFHYEDTDERILCGIDLDNAVAEPTTPEQFTDSAADWAQHIMQAIPSRWELSPSGKGAKTFIWLTRAFLDSSGWGVNADGRFVGHNVKYADKSKPQFEMYVQGRYFTLTGWVLPDFDFPILDGTAAEDGVQMLLELRRKYDADKAAETAARRNEGQRVPVATPSPSPDGNEGKDSQYKIAVNLWREIADSLTQEDVVRLICEATNSTATEHQSGGQIRVLGNGGLDVAPDGKWYGFGFENGSGSAAALAWRLGYWNPESRTKFKMPTGAGFWQLVRDAAAWAGRPLPSELEPKRRGRPRQAEIAPEDVPEVDAATGKPIMCVYALNLPAHGAELWQHIEARYRAEPELFQTGFEQLSQVKRYRDEDGRMAWRTKRMGVADIRAIALDTVSVQEPHGGELRSYNPPASLWEHMLVTIPDSIPHLRMVSTSPIVNRDGEIIRNGYDATSGILVDYSGVLPPIPDSPSASDIAKARGWFDDVLSEFCFADEASKTHAIMLGLAPLMRDATGINKMFVVDAPLPGSGKTLLAEVMLSIAAGKNPNQLGLSPNEEERTKSLVAALMQKPAYMFFDNVGHEVDSPELARALTGGQYRGRLLGVSDFVDVPCYCTWAMTANNAGLSGELVRRSLRIRLQPQTPNPAQRITRRNEDELKRYALENRNMLLWAALTLIQAGLNYSGELPKLVGDWGSFGRAANIMNRICTAAGLGGLNANNEQFKAEADTDTADTLAFLGTWHNSEHKTTPVEAKKLHQMAIDAAFIGDRTPIKGFAAKLRKLRDRWFDVGDVRVCVRSHQSRENMMQWYLKVQELPAPSPSIPAPSPSNGNWWIAPHVVGGAVIADKWMVRHEDGTTQLVHGATQEDAARAYLATASSAAD